MAHPQPRGKGIRRRRPRLVVVVQEKYGHWEERKTPKNRSMKMSSLVDLDHGLVAGQEEVSWGSRRRGVHELERPSWHKI
jgi:hypothetical protein